MGDFIDDQTKGIIEELQGGTAFNRSFETTITTAHTALSGLTSQIPQTLTLLETSVQNTISGIADRVSASVDKVASFADHVASHFDNISDNIAKFASAQRLDNAMASSPDENACGSMHDHFGSITTEGPSLISQVQSGISTALDTFNEVRSAYADLQSAVASVRTGLITQLQQELAIELDNAKRTALTAAQTAITNQMNSAIRSVRESLTSTSVNILTGSRKTNAEALQTSMQSHDVSAANAVTQATTAISTIESKATDLKNRAESEVQAAEDAVSKLTTLGNASSIKSLFGSDACVQTLLGYVGSDSLLSKLG